MTNALMAPPTVEVNDMLRVTTELKATTVSHVATLRA